ncbi:MAG TPA: glycoside hydrolase family 3 C-terminal domain-containing protein [Prolixibacteraceae bacterium]|nr:glycoside hydrolase family 3 C-terminal domain-containing protein [Prolixibacteraceae bacterium]
MIKKIILQTLFLSLCIEVSAQAKDESHPAYLDYTKSIEIRVADLVSKMTPEEKVSQMMYNSPAIDRLEIPEYNWWNECLHGVARSGNASVFPEPIGLAATFDDNLVSRIGTAISDEARAMYSANLKQGFRGQYGGLTFWTPNVNIFRDPRWGRGQETYGEDPYLTSVMGVALVKSLQGDNPKYLKVAACAKHFAVHSGPERLRHEFNAITDNKDLFETYLPAFKALVDAGVASVMCAYNRTNDKACCGSDVLLKEILRDKWNFKGYLVSDCWALKDIDAGHKITKTRAESAALALHNTVDLNCGDTYNPFLIDALKQGLVTEDEINKAVSTVFTTRFKLGMFDPEKENPYNNISADVINCEMHRNLALEAAEKSLVLLKNDKNILPLKKNTKSLFVTGPNASNIDVLMGNYYGVNNNMTTILEGIVGKVEAGCQVQYKPGIMLDRTNTNPIDWTTGDAKATDAVIVVMGISGLIEGEEGEAIASEHFGDRLDYNLPPNQIEFLKKMRKDNSKPVIAVITGGSPMNLAEINELADAVLLVWYPGEEGGKAVANVLFGDVSPSGKLPITFPKSIDQLPPYDDYSMAGRTYRYMTAEPMFPFGFGMSFTKFLFSQPIFSNKVIKENGTIEVSVEVKNIGKMKASETVQFYLTAPSSENLKLPLYSLKGFKRVELSAGESQTVNFLLDSELLASINNAGERVILPGTYQVNIGESSPGSRSIQLGAAMAPVCEFQIKK